MMRSALRETYIHRTTGLIIIIMRWIRLQNKKRNEIKSCSLFHIFILLAYTDITSPQKIHQLVVPPLEAVRIGSNARITCRYHGIGKQLDIQYITWTKVFISGGKANVYGYDKCTGEDSGYNDLMGRSLLDVVKPSNLFNKRRDYTNDTNHKISNVRKNMFTFYKTLNKTIDEGNILSKQNDLIGSATLTIQNVQLKDEARYECLVKPIGEPAETDIQLLTVVVLPTMPIIKEPSILIENRNYTFVCNAFVGRPTGVLQWFIKVDDGAFQMLPDEQVQTQLLHYSNGTSSAESHLHINVTTYTQAATIRCEVSSRAMRPWEKRLSSEIKLNILHPPRKGRILYDSTTTHYYCDSMGNPKPSYIWMWVLNDGTKTILSTNSYLDLSPIQSTGILQFHCLASNVIDKQRYTIVMKTKIKIEGNTPPPQTTTTNMPNYSNLKEDKLEENSTFLEWNVALGEPYKIESQEDIHDYDTSQANTFPLWDIIHGYVGSNPILNTNYNISQISETLGNKYHMNKSHNVQNSASSYIDQDVIKPLNIEIKTMKMDQYKPENNRYMEKNTLYPRYTANTMTPDSSINLSTVTQSIATSTVNSLNNGKIQESASNLKVSSSELFEMSPENYEYIDDNVLGKREETSLADNEHGNIPKKSNNKTKEQITDTKVRRIESVQAGKKNNKLKTGSRRRAITGGASIDYDVVSDIAVVPDVPKMPVITLSELISGRYKKMRPTRKELSTISSNHLVPWKKDGNVDFAKVFQHVPGHTKRLIVKKISKIRRNLNTFLAKYKRHQIQFADAKEGNDDYTKNTHWSHGNDNLYMHVSANKLEYKQGYNDKDVRHQPILDDYNYDYEIQNKHTLLNHITDNPIFLSYNVQTTDDANQDYVESPLQDSFQNEQQNSFQNEQLIANNEYGILLTQNEFNEPKIEDVVRKSKTKSNKLTNNVHEKVQFTGRQAKMYMNHLNLPMSTALNQGMHLLDPVQNKIYLDLNEETHWLNREIKDTAQLNTKDKLQQTKEAFLSSQYGTDIQELPGSKNKLYRRIQRVPEKNLNSKKPDSLDREWESSNLKRIQTEKANVLPPFYQLNKHASFERISLAGNKEYNCKSKTNGVYGGGCRAFYRCVDGQTHRVECITPFVFNKRTGKCDNAIRAPSPCGDWQDCQNKPNGKYADLEKKCRFYYTCYQGMFLGHNECNEGTIFNEEDQVCDWPHSVNSSCMNN